MTNHDVVEIWQWVVLVAAAFRFYDLEKRLRVLEKK
jgi:hypothetical protein